MGPRSRTAFSTVLGVALLLYSLVSSILPHLSDGRDIGLAAVAYGGALLFALVPLGIRALHPQRIWFLLFVVMIGRFGLRLLFTLLDDALPEESALVDGLATALTALGLVLWFVISLSLMITPVPGQRRLSRFAGLLAGLSTLAASVSLFPGLDAGIFSLASASASALRALTAVLLGAVLLAPPEEHGTLLDAREGPAPGPKLLQTGAFGLLTFAFGIMLMSRDSSWMDFAGSAAALGFFFVPFGFWGRRGGRLDRLTAIVGWSHFVSIGLLATRVVRSRHSEWVIGVPFVAYIILIIISHIRARRLGSPKLAWAAALSALIYMGGPLYAGIGRPSHFVRGLILSAALLPILLAAIHHLRIADRSATP